MTEWAGFKVVIIQASRLIYGQIILYLLLLWYSWHWWAEGCYSR